MNYVTYIREMVGTKPVILPGAVVIIRNEKNHVLLQKRDYPENVWGLPGGIMELDETIENCAIREVYEETQLEIDSLKFVHVASGPSNYAVAKNGDEFYSLTIVFTTNSYKGELFVDNNETKDLRFYSTDELPAQMIRSHRSFLEIFKQQRQS